jgi:hypothetical protein
MNPLKFFAVLAMALALVSGCMSSARYRKSQPDYQKAADMMVHGGNKHMVESDWGVPDGKKTLAGGSEIWRYENRPDGKNYVFYFGVDGKLIDVEASGASGL